MKFEELVIVTMCLLFGFFLVGGLMGYAIGGVVAYNNNINILDSCFVEDIECPEVNDCNCIEDDKFFHYSYEIENIFNDTFIRLSYDKIAFDFYQRNERYYSMEFSDYGELYKSFECRISLEHNEIKMGVSNLTCIYESLENCTHEYTAKIYKEEDW